MRRAFSSRLIPGTLLLVLVTLSTGLPSHYHGDGLDDVTEIAAADHHDHGVILTEQANRLPSASFGLAIPPRTVVLQESPILAAPEDPPFDRVVPHERPPPSSSPRAPPVSS